MPLLNFAVAFSIFDLQNNGLATTKSGVWGLGYSHYTRPASTLPVTQVGLDTTNTISIDVKLLP